MKSHFHSNYFVLCIWAIVFLVLVGCNNTLQKKQSNLLGNETIDLSKTKDVISFSTPQKGGKGVEKPLLPHLYRLLKKWCLLIIQIIPKDQNILN